MPLDDAELASRVTSKQELQQEHGIATGPHQVVSPVDCNNVKDAGFLSETLAYICSSDHSTRKKVNTQTQQMSSLLNPAGLQVCLCLLR